MRGRIWVGAVHKKIRRTVLVVQGSIDEQRVCVCMGLRVRVFFLGLDTGVLSECLSTAPRRGLLFFFFSFHFLLVGAFSTVEHTLGACKRGDGQERHLVVAVFCRLGFFFAADVAALPCSSSR